MLKGEIGESNLRLKAVKYGHAISDIVPKYENTYYLPENNQAQSVAVSRSKMIGLDKLLNINTSSSISRDAMTARQPFS
jgi:hypothetical protein